METVFQENLPTRKPVWLRKRIPGGVAYTAVRQKVLTHQLHTVCESAQCPNLGQCWAEGTATFMILGDICTRSCGFCAVKTGRPTELDLQEPERVASAARLMELRYVVLTSVTRDELIDGGSTLWSATVRAVRKALPNCHVETLIPDFKGDEIALQTVLDSRPEVLNHNVEMVPRFYRQARPQAKYERSLQVLERAKQQGFITKSSLMLGFGETDEEVEKVLQDLRGIRVDIITLGQYLQPTAQHLKVVRYLTPEQFDLWKQKGLSMGFPVVESGPLVRSSWRAEESYRQAKSHFFKI